MADVISDSRYWLAGVCSVWGLIAVVGGMLCKSDKPSIIVNVLFTYFYVIGPVMGLRYLTLGHSTCSYT